MKDTGSELVKKYGSGAEGDIDKYYHPLLQCKLAQKGIVHAVNGQITGGGKELVDYVTKTKAGKLSQKEILGDGINDLIHNIYGGILGTFNKDISCEDMLEDKLTKRMRDASIR